MRKSYKLLQILILDNHEQKIIWHDDSNHFYN